MKKLCRKIVSIFPKGIQNLYYKYEEILMYLIFGVLTTVVSFITAGIAKWGLESAGLASGFVSTISTVISWICAVTFAYITNRLWVFDSDAKGFKGIITEAAGFYGGRVFTLIVETVMMYIGVTLLSVNYWISKILNYVISKLLVFRNKGNEEKVVKVEK